MSQHDEGVRLRHMLDAARKAVALVSGQTREEIDKNEVVQLALARLLEIIGEASRKIAPAVRDAHPEIPWAEISGLRNRLVHAYFDVDLSVLLDIVSGDLPSLIDRLVSLLDSLEA